MKDELCRNFVELREKIHSYLTDDNDESNRMCHKNKT